MAKELELPTPKCPICKGTGLVFSPMNRTGRNETAARCNACRGKPLPHWEARDE